MTHPRSPREGATSVTVPLGDLALSDRESIFHAPRAGDVALLCVLVAVLLGNGVWIWRSLGVNSHAGRAIFFGLLLLCAYWCALVYIFKLSLSARISPRSLSVVRGPWRVEIRWSELARLMERVQPVDGRRYRWVIALARDGRRISVREDAIGDYARFRREAYERYRVWRDHGGTWGAIGGGPFVARETVRDEAQWWAIAAAMIALPGVYFALLLPETNPLGYTLLAVALGCVALMARVFLRRQTYTIERQFVQTRSALKRVRLTWSEITRVERTRAASSNLILAVVALGRLALRLAARGDTGIRSFAWSPRVPEYLALRGGGRQARVRLHRLMQPDELLAWIEFYDQASRWSSTGHTTSKPSAAPVAETAPRAATSHPTSRPSGPLTGPAAGPHSRPLSQPLAGAASGPASASAVAFNFPDLPDLSDLSGASGPLDPWGGGRAGEVILPEPSTPSRPFTGARTTAHVLPDLPDRSPLADEPPDDLVARAATGQESQESQDDAWLRETSALFSMGDGGAGSNGVGRGVVDADPAPGAPPEPEPWRKRAPQWEQWDDQAEWPAEPPQWEQREQRMPVVRPTAPQAPQAARPADEGGWADAWGEQTAQPDERGADDARPGKGEPPDGTSEGDAAAEAAPQTPWRDASWQPPILPRYGPPGDDPHGERH